MRCVFIHSLVNPASFLQPLFHQLYMKTMTRQSKTSGHPLVAGCTIGHKPLPLPVELQTQSSCQFFLKMVSATFRSSYHAGVCSSVNYFQQFGFNYSFDETALLSFLVFFSG